MKKLYILILFFGIIGSNYSFADCVTGYACSIDSLQAQNTLLEEHFINELNQYYENTINEDFLLGNITQDFEYKDFFPFLTLINISSNKNLQ